jgi:hypothetical protein
MINNLIVNTWETVKWQLITIEGISSMLYTKCTVPVVVVHNQDCLLIG